MTIAFEDFQVLQAAETIADQIWKEVLKWDEFARDVVGKQLARAADSIGANIAEGFGRFNYGEKVTFFYYSRGSLYETKYWLNRVLKRDLMPVVMTQSFASQLTLVARQLNSLAASTKEQRAAQSKSPKTLHESTANYLIAIDLPDELFTEKDLAWLEA